MRLVRSVGMWFFSLRYGKPLEDHKPTTAWSNVFQNSHSCCWLENELQWEQKWKQGDKWREKSIMVQAGNDSELSTYGSRGDGEKQSAHSLFPCLHIWALAGHGSTMGYVEPWCNEVEDTYWVGRKGRGILLWAFLVGNLLSTVTTWTGEPEHIIQSIVRGL